MKRFLLFLTNEFRLARTAAPVHLVAILQPAVMYLLMGTILVHPTFDMNVRRPTDDLGWELVAAMEEVGSPIGDPYIHPILVESAQEPDMRQVVSVERVEGVPTAVQRFGLVDSNVVKNYRNRLTAAALRLWNDELDSRAVAVVERPWLPWDVPFSVFFGMAMLPMAVAIAASIIGGVLTAQEFELHTILEYRLAPAPLWLILGARLTRLALSGLISGGILLIAIGLTIGYWPHPLWRVGLVLLPVGVIAGCVGVIAGLLLQKGIPAFLVGLVTSFVGWILGSSFGLAAGFNPVYEFISRLTPNTHAVELLFPAYFGVALGSPWPSALILLLMSAGMVALTVETYRRRVLKVS
jgi:hypothetical protein